MDNRSKNTVTRIDQENSGIFIRETPGARILSIVTRKLTAVSGEDAPSINCPATQKSVPGLVAEAPEDYGAYPVQPTSPAPPVKYPMYNTIPPVGSSQ